MLNEQGDQPYKSSVVLVSQFFHPDTSANATVLSELAVGLADRGIDVSVVTTQPSYSSDDRKSNHPAKETYKGVSVRRLPATRFDRNQGLTKRMINEFSFFLMAFIYLILQQRGNIVLLSSTPTFLPIASWPLRFRGYQPVPVVMDLYPGMAVALGYLEEDSGVRRIWDWLNKHAYHQAAVTITIGETMAERLKSEYGEIPIHVVHNWADGEFIKPMNKTENSFARKHGFIEQFTLLYSGNLGRHHDLKSLVKAASVLEGEEIPPFEFVFIGEGGQKEPLKELVEDEGIESVQFMPYQPMEKLPQSLTSADVSIVTMAEGVEGLCVSSKFYTALASGQAVLAISASGAEIARVVNETNCGEHIEPNEPIEIANVVRSWIKNPASVNQMGDIAREVFEERFTKSDAIDSYYNILQDINRNQK